MLPGTRRDNPIPLRHVKADQKLERETCRIEQWCPVQHWKATHNWSQASSLVSASYKRLKRSPPAMNSVTSMVFDSFSQTPRNPTTFSARSFFRIATCIVGHQQTQQVLHVTNSRHMADSGTFSLTGSLSFNFGLSLQTEAQDGRVPA